MLCESMWEHSAVMPAPEMTVVRLLSGKCAGSFWHQDSGSIFFLWRPDILEKASKVPLLYPCARNAIGEEGLDEADALPCLDLQRGVSLRCCE